MAERLPETKGNQVDFHTCVKCRQPSENKLFLLSCLHPFCEECVAETDDVIECGVCERETIKDPKRPLQANFIQDIRQAATSFRENKPCVLCESMRNTSVPGTHMCPECEGANFCDDCIRGHASLPTMRAHQPVKIADIKDEDIRKTFASSHQPCPNHSNQAKPCFLEFYCKTCKSPQCALDKVDCAQKRHWLVTVGDMRKNVEEITDANLRKLKSNVAKLDAKCAELKGLRSGWLVTASTKVADIDLRADLVRNKFPKLLEEVISVHKKNIKTYFQRQNDLYGQKLEALQKTRASVDTLSQLVAQFKRFCFTVTDQTSSDFLKASVDTALNDLTNEMNQVAKVTDNCEVTLEKPNLMKARPLVELMFGEVYLPWTKPADSITGLLDQMARGGPTALKEIMRVDCSKMTRITGFDVTDDGDVLVSGEDERDYIMEVISSKGHLKKTFSANASSASLVKIANFQIYLLADGRIKVLNNEGTLLREVKGQGKLLQSDGLEVTQDKIYIADSSKNLIYSTAISGEKLKLWNSDSVRLSRPLHLCALDDGDLVVSNFDGHCITVLDRRGRFKAMYGRQGNKDGELNYPCGVCTDSKRRLLVADKDNNRITVLTRHCRLLGHVTFEDASLLRKPTLVKICSATQRLVIAHSGNKLSFFKPSGDY